MTKLNQNQNGSIKYVQVTIPSLDEIGLEVWDHP